MKAFPVINAISGHYTGDELRFLFLNTDEDPGGWKRALDFTHTARHPGHFRVKNPDFGQLAMVGLNVYPRYMIVNREGELMEFHASVPNADYVADLLKRIRLGQGAEAGSTFGG